VLINAADGKCRERDFGCDCANQVEADEFGEFFGLTREDRANSDVIGSGQHGGSGLFYGMCGDPNQFSGAENASRRCQVEVILPEVDPVGLAGKCKVRAVIEDPAAFGVSQFLSHDCGSLQ